MASLGVRLAILLAVFLAITPGASGQEEEPPVNQVLQEQAGQLSKLCRTDVAVSFLGAVEALPVPGTRVVFYNRTTGDALRPEEAAKRKPDELEGYEEKTLDPQFYYFTRYGSPLAFVRPLEILGSSGLESLEGVRIADFGFGSIGQLRLLASRGAHVVGIEVDRLLEVLYDAPGDTGPIPRILPEPAGSPGSIRLLFGNYPAQSGLVEAVGDGLTAFISKNTLKNGYIHPAQEVDSRMLVHLGVDDSTFVRAVHAALGPGGLFLIYNLCPPQSEERYIPWADGRSPFPRELFESAGFEVLAFDVDDTGPAREMGRVLGWDESMDLQNDLFGTYTLVRKR